jgi:hypothetical protein
VSFGLIERGTAFRVAYLAISVAFDDFNRSMLKGVKQMPDLPTASTAEQPQLAFHRFVQQKRQHLLRPHAVQPLRLGQGLTLHGG